MAPNPALLMFVALRAAERQTMEAVAATGADITQAQARLMARLDHEHGSRLTDLAEQADVTKQTAGALVDQLQRGGYVTRVPDPSDGRARRVTLTARGKELADAANAVVAQVHAQWRKHLGAKAYDQMVDSLTRLREITDPYR
ncbi:MarR family transcriptional regulator [Mycobacteroides saopaulense]|uniref:MarR family winged helix-turn-helix transcriptional regulator n=1 Tax=Mycobacteroides saopaulense TaxID=1578165 RepID=UPI0007224571|nr:MarR family transcriptional regulator [Mycobacteroides saopaulense]ALR11146.1 MarR family transcriptional regulator [Mycobacteroides saopaulense]